MELTFELFAALYKLLHQSGHFWIRCLVVEGRLIKNNNNNNLTKRGTNKDKHKVFKMF